MQLTASNLTPYLAYGGSCISLFLKSSQKTIACGNAAILHFSIFNKDNFDYYKKISLYRVSKTDQTHTVFPL